MKKNPRYYFYSTHYKKWIVRKNKIDYGRFNTEEEAQIAVELYQKYGWEKENRWKVKAEIKEIGGNKIASRVTNGGSITHDSP